MRSAILRTTPSGHWSRNCSSYLTMRSTMSDALLRKLAQAEGPCAMIVLSDESSLKALLDKARSVLSKDHAKILKPLEGITPPGEQGVSLFFCAPGLFEQVQTTLKLPESVTVDEKFALRPLLPLKESDREFYILALSMGRTRLLLCNSRLAEEVPLPAETAMSLEQSASIDTPDHRQENMSAGGQNGGMKGVVFSTSSLPETKGLYLANFLTQLERGVHTVLNGSCAPLIIPAVDHERSAYMRVNTYHRVVEPGLSGA